MREARDTAIRDINRWMNAWEQAAWISDLRGFDTPTITTASTDGNTIELNQTDPLYEVRPEEVDPWTPF